MPRLTQGRNAGSTAGYPVEQGPLQRAQQALEAQAVPDVNFLGGAGTTYIAPDTPVTPQYTYGAVAGGSVDTAQWQAPAPNFYSTPDTPTIPPKAYKSYRQRLEYLADTDRAKLRQEALAAAVKVWEGSDKTKPLCELADEYEQWLLGNG